MKKILSVLFGVVCIYTSNCFGAAVPLKIWLDTNQSGSPVTNESSLVINSSSNTVLFQRYNGADWVNLTYSGGVAASLFDAYTILYADTDNTPAALTVGASTIVGRQASGGIVAIAKASQAEMEAGTETAMRAMTPQGIFQAIAAWMLVGHAMVLDYAAGFDPSATDYKFGYDSTANVLKMGDEDGSGYKSWSPYQALTGLTPPVVLTHASGVHDGSNDAAIMTDSGESFTTNAMVGMTLYNVTDASSCTVTANDGTTITCTLAGGTDNNWDTDDVWQVGPGPNQSGSAFYVSAASTIRHPATAGYQAAYYVDGAITLTIEVADAMTIVGATAAAIDAGDTIDSPSTAGSFICLHNKSATSAATWGKNGTWTDGGAS